MKDTKLYIIIVIAALVIGLGVGFYASYQILVAPIKAEAAYTIATLEAKVREATEKTVKEFIDEIENSTDTNIIDEYLSPELRERLRELLGE
jgi:hypothetical protein